MKKFVLMLLISLSSVVLYADDSLYIGWLGLGGSSGGVSNYQGTQLSPIDTGKLTIFGGIGAKILPPLPIYIGFEFNFMIAKVGEDSQSALVYNQELQDTGSGYVFYSWLSLAGFKANYWDTDLSPRAVATLSLAEGFLTGSFFVGLNFNYLTMDWEYDSDVNDPNNPIQKGEETLAGPVIQAVAGLRATLFIFYLDYTRYFNFSDGKVDRTKIAGNRVSIGLHLTF